MKNFKTYLKTFGTGLMFAISADGYRRTVKNDIKNEETERVLNETIRRSVELTNKLSEQVEQNIINNAEINNNLDKIKTGLETIQNKVDGLNSSNNNNSIDSLKEEASKVNGFIDKVLEFINSSSSQNNNNLNFQTFQDLLDNYYKFFDSLTVIQKGALAHTLLCLIILYNI